MYCTLIVFNGEKLILSYPKLFHLAIPTLKVTNINLHNFSIKQLLYLLIQ